MGRSPSPADEFRRSLAVEGCNVLFEVVGLLGIRNGVRARHRMGRRNGPSSSMNRACFRLPDEEWRIVAAFGPSLASFKRPRWLVFVDAKSPSGKPPAAIACGRGIRASLLSPEAPPRPSPTGVSGQQLALPDAEGPAQSLAVMIEREGTLAPGRVGAVWGPYDVLLRRRLHPKGACSQLRTI